MNNSDGSGGLGVILFLLVVAGLIWLVRRGGLAGIISEQQAERMPARSTSLHSAALAEPPPQAAVAPIAGSVQVLTNAELSAQLKTGNDVATVPAEVIAPRMADAPARLEQVDAFYADELNALELRLGDLVPEIISPKSIKAVGEQVQDKLAKLKDMQGGFGAALQFVESAWHLGGAKAALENTRLRRSLREMSDAERAILRLAEVLAVLGRMSLADVVRVKLPIIWNKGECMIETLEGYEVAHKHAALMEAVKFVVSAHAGEIARASELTQTRLREALQPGSGLGPADRTMLESLLYAGNHWMTALEGATALRGHAPEDQTLRLGTFGPDGPDLLYGSRESLATIAPPGAGKSQALVMRNLLLHQGPAVVLDIKGEMARGSYAARKANVGRCEFFAPSHAKASRRYNPLDQVSTDPERAWDEARRLADLLVVPNPRGDEYFEGRARDMITTAVLDVALSEHGERRAMASVLDRLFISTDEAALAWFTHLEGLDVPQLRRQAMALKGMPAKQREGIMDSARRQLEVWQSPSLDALSRASDFDADFLRRENGTLYLVVPLEDVKKYASVLRVLIGQLIHQLCRAEPEHNAPVVTFFLDELPRLGRMDVIEEALDVGRGYGVRLWLFCQNLGQLRTTYPNADGMLANCMARIFMNPDETTARELSRMLGERRGLLDGRRKPLAEPSELSGPAFANDLVVFSRGNPPARLSKRMAHSDLLCQLAVGLSS